MENIGYGFDLDGLQQVEWAEERYSRKKEWPKAKCGAGACKVRKRFEVWLEGVVQNRTGERCSWQ